MFFWMPLPYFFSMLTHAGSPKMKCQMASQK
jgi:hypothetical protein